MQNKSVYLYINLCIYLFINIKKMYLFVSTGSLTAMEKHQGVVVRAGGTVVHGDKH